MIMRRTGLLFLMVFLASCSMWGEKRAENERSSELYVRKGVAYMEEGRYEQARTDLERALDLNSSNSEAHNAMAVLYERLDKPDKARSHYKRAVSLGEHNYAAWNNYSRFLCSHGDFEDGIELLDKVIDSRLYTQPWLVLTNKGVCYKLAGNPEEAEHSLREALESQPNFAPALLELAQLSYNNAQYMKARAFLQRYISLVQPTAETLWLAVKTEEALGSKATMQAYLKQLRERFADSPEAVEAKKAYPTP